MILRFTSPYVLRPGAVAKLLKLSYTELVSAEPTIWKQEAENWKAFDHAVFKNFRSIGDFIFLSWFGKHLVGFGSYDPRQGPELGIIGHNCIIPRFRRRGFGKQQILEILRLLIGMGVRKARVLTHEHPFFTPAQQMYLSCGFQETQRLAWERDPRLKLIEYEKNLTG
jgi:GNAT superfamily N-acetyltransferase